MNLQEQLLQRSDNQCELCQSVNDLQVYAVPPQSSATAENNILICSICKSQLEKTADMDKDHWRCLTGSMWSEVPAVQVVSWRMLNRLKDESWALDNLDMLYLEDETLAWAKAAGDDEDEVAAAFHKDVNGNLLQNGDSIVITKTLDVKGSSISAKLGTVVKNIRLVDDNTDQIEGRVEGQLIVILTKYARKQFSL